MSRYLIPAMLLPAIVPNVAAARETPVKIHVAYRDLDLQSQAGLRMFDRRIEGAIAELCPDFGSIELARQRLVSRCRAAVRASVADQRAAVLARAGRGDVEFASRAVR